ncbi:MAG: asparagine synthase (glutamine-hydrolyzing) [Saprospiraceae bacterium]
MCGLAGFYILGNIKLSKIDLVNATNTLSHRGPDDAGYYFNDKIGLGHRRLSIIDLSAAGHQPMFSQDKNYTIVFNGEIYNFKEIKAELVSLGCIFIGNSDTEVIINGYQYWGNKIFRKLNGIFAIAIWDSIKRKVVLCRDRMGVKPLYFYYSKDLLLFGSEIKSILSYSIVKARVDFQSFHEFLYYGNPIGDNTMFSDIRKLPAGKYLEITESGLSLNSYWQHEDVEIEPSTIKVDENIVINQVRNLLEQAVSRQLISDVPVGVFLSGGIDSSAITAFATKNYNGRLKSYSAGFDFDGGHNELPLAKKVAVKFGTEHHEMMIYGKNIKDIIYLMVKHHDEPFSDAANIPLYLMTREVKKDCKVILQGDGGDELFGGYARYQIMSKFNLYKNLFSISHSLLPIMPFPYVREKTERFFPLFSQKTKGDMFAKFLTVESNVSNTPESLISKSLRQKIKSTHPFKVYHELSERFSFLKDDVQRLLWMDTCIILQNQFLEKVDKSTMANGVEVRVPFLDNDLVSYALSLPSELKVKNGVKKYLLKKALHNILPNEVLYGPKKGFGVPYQNWIKGPLKEFMLEVFYSSNIKKLQIFDYEELSVRIDEHCSGKRDWGFTLWKMLNFCIWLEEYKVEME